MKGMLWKASKKMSLKTYFELDMSKNNENI